MANDTKAVMPEEQESPVKRVLERLNQKETENPLKSVEMATEDNMNMIDGIPNNTTSKEKETKKEEKPLQKGEKGYLSQKINEMKQKSKALSQGKDGLDKDKLLEKVNNKDER